MKITPVILSGGSGTRLWPLSRKFYPKQFIPLAGSLTMLQETLKRLEGIENLDDPIILCNTDHRFLVAEQLHQVGITKSKIILEPTGRNTAPAIAVAAHFVENKLTDCQENNILLVLSADHVINDVDSFHESINASLEFAVKGSLIALGVEPNHPKTGYGYIKKGIRLNKFVNKIEKFKEKPSKLDAQRYLDEGLYLWNSGMFMFNSKLLLKELQIFSGDIVKNTSLAVQNATLDLDFIRLDRDSFEACEDVSIDYALMEKTDKALVVSLDADWNDIGSWSALYEIGNKDKSNNVIHGDVITSGTSNSYLRTDKNVLVTIGIENLIIINTPDATLVASKNNEQNLKKIIEQFKKNERTEGEIHQKVYRPWGWYDSFEKGDQYQVKRICVSPGASLSLQKHSHRAEHWIVLTGVATITKGDKVEKLTENQSTYIPIGEVHRLENREETFLEIIEVQSGNYLGEDDIERFEDNYGRS